MKTDIFNIKYYTTFNFLSINTNFKLKKSFVIRIQ